MPKVMCVHCVWGGGGGGAECYEKRRSFEELSLEVTLFSYAIIVLTWSRICADMQ